MARPCVISLLLVSAPCLLLSQEVSQSGLRLKAPRAIVALPERAPSAMAASVHPLATDAALEIMRKGGNAIDAAVAIAFVLAVVHPEAGNIAGGGFLMAHLVGGKQAVIDYGFQMPLAATEAMFDGVVNKNTGYKSIGVPGTAAGMGLAHSKYGKLKWSECLEPARRIAKEGFPASQRMEMILKLQVPVMKTHSETAKIFLKGSDQPLKQGEPVVQKDLAGTISRMQKHGWREFYTGDTAKRMVEDFKANGGVITMEDFEKYQAVEKEPLRINYRGFPILVTPPASAGGLVMAVALNTLNNFELKLGMEGSSTVRHLQIEAMRAGVRARNLLTGGQQPIEQLISVSYGREAAQAISLDHAGIKEAMPSSQGAESADTTHFTVADHYGNIVTNTYTLNGFYGSQVIPKGTGVLMNNYISLDNVRTIKPGGRIFSSMTPTMILRQDGTPWAAFGTPGSMTIPSTNMQIVINLIDFKMGLRDAVEYPRIHFDSSSVEEEPGALVFDVAEKLKSMGHKISTTMRSQGDVSAIAIEEGTRWKQGWADGRRGGVVKGY